MIVGVAARVVPTLNGVDPRRLPRLWLPFVLLNTGCALRVLGQTATDFTASSFPVAGVSGLLEVTGLAIWGAHLWRIMAGRVPTAETAEQQPDDGTIRPEAYVGVVLDRHPELLDTFLSFGFTPLANPLVRRALASHVTLRAACGLAGVDVDRLVAALNARLTPASADTAPAPRACDCCRGA
jgi:hypothetical protein